MARSPAWEEEAPKTSAGVAVTDDTSLVKPPTGKSHGQQPTGSETAIVETPEDSVRIADVGDDTIFAKQSTGNSHGGGAVESSGSGASKPVSTEPTSSTSPETSKYCDHGEF